MPRKFKEILIIILIGICFYMQKCEQCGGSVEVTKNESKEAKAMIKESLKTRGVATEIYTIKCIKCDHILNIETN